MRLFKYIRNYLWDLTEIRNLCKVSRQLHFDRQVCCFRPVHWHFSIDWVFLVSWFVSFRVCSVFAESWCLQQSLLLGHSFCRRFFGVKIDPRGHPHANSVALTMVSLPNPTSSPLQEKYNYFITLIILNIIQSK